MFNSPETQRKENTFLNQKTFVSKSGKKFLSFYVQNNSIVKNISIYNL